MEFGDRIKSMRIDRAMTQKELGKYLGVTELSVRCWENGTKNPSMSAIMSLSELFNVSTDYLLGMQTGDADDNPFLNQRERSLLINYRLLDVYGRRAVDTICEIEKDRMETISKQHLVHDSTHNHIRIPSRYIPKYTTPSAAGYSVPLDGDSFEMILVNENVPYDADFAVRIQGNSMSPYINDGDTVYVKKDCDLSVGDIGIFCVDGAMYCKQYYIDKDRTLTLVSANPEMRHTNIHAGQESGLDVRCYGKVLLEFKVELPKYLFE